MVAKSKSAISFGQAVSFAFRNAFRYIFSFLGVSIVGVILMLASLLPVLLVVGPYFYNAVPTIARVFNAEYGQAFIMAANNMPFSWLSTLLGTLSGILFFIAALWWSGALIRKACSIYSKKNVGVFGAYNIAPAVLWRYIVGMVTIMLFMIAAIFMLFLPASFLLTFALTAFASHALMTLKFFLGVGALTLSIMLFSAALIALVRLVIRMIFFCYVIIDKQMVSVRKALKESSKIINGRLMHIILFVIAFGLINAFVTRWHMIFNVIPVPMIVRIVAAGISTAIAVLIMQPATVLFWAYLYKKLGTAR